MINFKPSEKKTPVADWLKKQGLFAHLFKRNDTEELPARHPGLHRPQVGGTAKERGVSG
jgi:hypothetical protein